MGYQKCTNWCSLPHFTPVTQGLTGDIGWVLSRFQFLYTIFFITYFYFFSIHLNFQKIFFHFKNYN